MEKSHYTHKFSGRRVADLRSLLQAASLPSQNELPRSPKGRKPIFGAALLWISSLQSPRFATHHVIVYNARGSGSPTALPLAV